MMYDGTELLEIFASDLELRQLTAHTIEGYKSNVKIFLQYYPDPLHVGRQELQEFLKILLGKNLAGSTIKSYFISLNAFYEWMLYEKIVTANPVQGFRKRYLSRKIRKKTRQLIDCDAATQLIRMAGHIQDKAMMMVLAKTGMRRGELLDMQISDLDFERQLIRCPPKPKRSNCTMFMDDELYFILDFYIRWWDNHAPEGCLWLWINPSGKRVHKDHLGRVLARLGEQLGLHDPNTDDLDRKLTPHCFRHFFVTQLFRNGMDPEYIRWLRGDSMEVSSWQIYNHIDTEAVRAEYIKYIPKLL